MEISAQISGDGFSMKDLLAKSEFDLPKVGQVLTGDIIGISKNSVLVDLGALGTGIVYPGEFYDNPNLQKALKAGQEISAILLDLENEEGYRELSLRQAQMTTAWQDIKDKKENGEVIDTKVVNINKGGLIVEINGIQGFLPLSQLLAEHYPKVEGGDTAKIVQALQKFRNQDIKVKIIDFSEGENKLIVSERAISDTQLKEEIAKLKIGDVVDAEITDVTDFGAFALIESPAASQADVTAEQKLPLEETQTEGTESAEGTENKENQETGGRGKIEGLIHISEIDWKLIENPRDFLQAGQIVKAKIVNIEGNKVSLSLKALKPDPWEKIEEKYTVGQTINGDIAKITNYGVLVRLVPTPQSGVEDPRSTSSIGNEEIYGLVPVSEFGEKKPSESLKVGDKLNVAIVSIDPKEHKLLLTLQEEKNDK